jgi:hydrogenase maturation protease
VLSKKSKLILGCGNLLLQDEGVGVHLIEYLKGKELPPDTELLDGGTAGFALVDFIRDAEKVVIVDAVKAGGKPGEIYCFGPEDFEAEDSPKTSLHDITLKDVFAMAKKLGELPQIRIIGIEPKSIDYGLDLSPEIKQLLPKIAELAIEQIKDD